MIDLGFIQDGFFSKRVKLQDEDRLRHMQIIGTTGCGKTKSALLPMIIQDIRNGNGVTIIDGKGDSELLESIYYAAKELNRAKDFEYFSFHHSSNSIDLFQNGNNLEITERIINALNFDEEFYRSVQYSKLYEILSSNQIQSVDQILQKIPDKENFEGLRAKLSKFACHEYEKYFRSQNSINFLDSLNNSKISVISLDTMTFADLAVSLGKIVLQSIQGLLHKVKIPRTHFLYLDEFSPFAYEGFSELLNKARGFKLGIIISHQSKGDLLKVSDSFCDQVITNTNIKLFFKANDPESAEYFSNLIGTKKAIKQSKVKSGGGVFSFVQSYSEQEVEAFIVHPNKLKSMPIGKAILVYQGQSQKIKNEITLNFCKSQKAELPKFVQKEIPKEEDFFAEILIRKDELCKKH